jgi:hypothetical protein
LEGTLPALPLILLLPLSLIRIILGWAFAPHPDPLLLLSAGTAGRETSKIFVINGRFM